MDALLLSNHRDMVTTKETSQARLRPWVPGARWPASTVVVVVGHYQVSPTMYTGIVLDRRTIVSVRERKSEC